MSTNVDWHSVLPNICSNSTKTFLEGFMDGFHKQANFPSDEAKMVFKHILEAIGGDILIRPDEIQLDWSSKVLDAFFNLIQRGLSLGLTEPVCHFLEKTYESLQRSSFPTCSGDFVIELILRFAGILKVLLVSEQRLWAISKALFKALIIKGVFHILPDHPEQRTKVRTPISMPSGI